MNRRDRLATHAGVLLLAVTFLTPMAEAGEPPESCLAIPGCPLESDIVKFGEGDPLYEIVGRIDLCHVCLDLGGGVIRLEVDAEFAFGPYDPALCPTAEGTVLDLLEGQFIQSGGGGPDSWYVFEPGASQSWDMPLDPDLRTACVSAGNLDYRIRDLRLTESGAEAVSMTPGPAPAFLDLPDNVRSSAGDRVDLPGLRFSQYLGFDFLDPGPTQLWADGLPARLDLVGGVSYRPNEVEIDPAATLSYAPPNPCTPAGQCLDDLVCEVQPGLPNCTGSAGIANLGFLDHPAWSLSGLARVLPDGLHAALSLDPGNTVIYEPLFPSGLRIVLEGPASIDLVASRLVAGTFAAGQATLTSLTAYDCPDYAQPITQALEMIGAGGIEIVADGGLLAPVDAIDGSGPLGWTFNEITGPGCGTLWTPPAPQADTGVPFAPLRRPDEELLASALPTVDGRGLYAGVNYNRTRACTLGSSIGGACQSDVDCSPGWSCGEPWSPRCGALATTPTWSTSIDGNAAVGKTILPSQTDRELVFYLRGSGVTGVFDGGFGTVPTGGGGATFAVQYENFGLAFLGSNPQYADSILGGSVIAPWPSDTSLPFEEMRVCLCGSLAGATLPQGLPTEKKLGYWDAPFRPYGFDFQTNAAGACPVPATDVCGGGDASAAMACVQAELEVPHFFPEFDGSFDLFPDGTSTTIVPTGVSRLDFEDNTLGLAPYRYDVGTFSLSDWAAAGSPGMQQVVVQGSAPFGFYDGNGELAVPHFGLSPAGIQVQRASHLAPGYRVDLHEKGNLSESTIGVTTKLAAGKLELQYRLDYLRPSALAVPVEVGTDENGRGLLFGYTRDGAADLKSVAVRSGFVADASAIRGDVGVAASLRLWKLTDPAVRPTVLGPLLPAAIEPDALYSGALGKLVGQDVWSPADLTPLLHASGAMAELAQAGHPDGLATMLPGSPLPIQAKDLSGALVFSGGGAKLDEVSIDATMSTGSTGKDLFSMQRGQLAVERFVDAGGRPISTFAHAAGIGGAIELPGEQSLGLPLGDAVQWKLDYDIHPTSGAFVFESLTGSLHVGQGGFGGIGFDELTATLKYYADGDWYFDAGAAASFRGKGAEAGLLFGNTKDMEPLRARDPDVARFLGKTDKFKGAYARLGVRYRLLDFGCPLYLSAGAEVGGWYLDGTAGGQVAGWVSGKGACLLSVKGKQKLIGGKVAGTYRLTGSLWVAGGIGFCDEEDWDSPGDVFDDDWCFGCVVKTSITASYPPKDLDVSGTKPKTQCD